MFVGLPPHYQQESIFARTGFAIPRSTTAQWVGYVGRWLIGHRLKVPDGSAIAPAIDYSLSRWAALTRYIDTGDLPADNNRVENLICPIALGRSNWLFAGSLRAEKRAANIMSLLHTARINGHEPHAYLKDILERLPTHPANRIEELLPYKWQPPSLGD
jgi:hypothetical protein